ncbi:MAG: DUF2191 domain-containing protein [Acidobacteria bacterium]|nr:DUF2191 domain-containing protein [Acidobacteriota bacterium]
MRTTITLDEDVAAKLRAESQRTGQPFKQVVNEYLRLGFTVRRRLQEQKRFKIKARALGLRPGISIDNIGELLEQVEGLSHR